MLSEISKKQKIVVMIGVLLAMLLSALDQTIVATAMPRIVQELQGLEYLSWVTTAYLLTSTIIIPIAGKISDLFGRKKIYLLGIGIFLIGSFLSGLSQNIFQLIFFRAIQGIGAGVLTSISFTIIGDLFVPSERGKWQGLFGGVFGIAAVAGPVLGGYLTDHASWRWNFYINLPIGIIALLAIIFLMPNIITEVKNKVIDYLGIITLTSFLSSLMLALVWGGTQYAWVSLQIMALLVVAFISFFIFIVVELRSKQPLLPLDLFKNSVFSVSVFITLLSSIGMFGAIIFIPLFAQTVLGVSATNSGTILTPMVISLVISSILAGQITSRTGRYKYLGIIGMGIATIALFFLSTINANTDQMGLVIRMIIMGIGLGLGLPIFTLAVQNAFDHSKLAVATSSVQLFRNIGSTIGTALMGSILNNELTNKLTSFHDNKFIQILSKINPKFSFQSVNINTIALLLSAQFQSKISALLSNVPMQQQEIVRSAFVSFTYSLKDAMASSIAKIYFISAFLLAGAFIATFFLKEIPLRKSHAVSKETMPENANEEVGEPILSI